MAEHESAHQHHLRSKVPEVTIGFWIVKILATTLGETGGDTVTMSWLGETTDHANPFGYLIGTAILAVVLLVRPAFAAELCDYLAGTHCNPGEKQ